MNIQQRIDELENQMAELECEIDKLMSLKQTEDNDFRGNLLGKYFTDGVRHMKIVKQTGSISFQILFITDYIDNRNNINDMFSIYLNDIYIDDNDYFNSFTEISAEDFYSVLDKAKCKIREI